MKLYHRTDAAEAILANGFRNSTGSYGLVDDQGRPFMLTGVFVSDHPLSMHEGATGEDVLRVIIPDDFDIDDWELPEFPEDGELPELPEDVKTYREWCLPAELLNRFPRRLLTDEEI